MSSEKHLRQFVIGRFFFTLLGIVAADTFLVIFIRKVMEPLANSAGIIDGDLTIKTIYHTLFVDHELMILWMILAIVAFVSMPIIVGAYSFTKSVTREIHKSELEFIKTQQENDRQRYLMISDIAHDLKTPMTTVSGYAQALSEGMVKEEEKQEYLDAITSKTARMNEMINLLFDYTKLNSEGFKVSTSKLDLCEFLREIVAASFTDIEEAGDELDVDIPEEQFMVDIDKMQMTRVINNLITNAIRHNGKGTKINVTLRKDGDDLMVFVADSGDIIPEELAQSLFQPFVMGDESRQTKGGTGLGLSIAKKIVELHGARIKLAQKPEVFRYQLGNEYNKSFVISFQSY